MGGADGASGAGYPGDVCTQDIYTSGTELPPWLSASVLDHRDEAFLQKDQWFHNADQDAQGRFRRAYVENLRDLQSASANSTDADRTKAFTSAIQRFPGGELHPINAPKNAYAGAPVNRSPDLMRTAKGAESLFAPSSEAMFGAIEGSETTVKVSDGKVTIKVPRSMIEMLGTYNAQHPGHEIALQDLPKYFFGASGIKTQNDLMERFEKHFTTENFNTWLESAKGREFVARNEATLGKNFKQRLVATGPSLLLSVVGLLSAEEMADVIGLDHSYHPQERFAFIVYTMHGSSALGRYGMQRAMRWRAGAAVAELEGVQKTTLRNGEEALELTLKARTPFGLRAISSAMRNLTAGRAAMLTAKGAYGIVKMPVTAGFHMGGGLLAQDITIIGLDYFFPEMSSETKSTLGFAGFMAPEAIEGLAGPRFGTVLSERIAKAFGVRAAEGAGTVATGAGRLIGGLAVAEGIAFMTDTGLAIGDRALSGDYSVYRRDVNMRAAYKAFEREEKAGYGLEPWEKSVRNFLAGKMPTICSFVWGNSVDMDTKAEVYHQDEVDSLAVRKELPEQIQQTLLRGVGDERERAEFYTGVHLDRLQDEIKLEGDVLALYEFMQRVKRDPSLAGIDRGEPYEQEIAKHAEEMLASPWQREAVIAAVLKGLRRDGEIAPSRKDAERVLNEPAKREQALGYLTFQLKNDDFDARLTLPAREACDDPNRKAFVLSVIAQHYRLSGQKNFTEGDAAKMLEDPSKREAVLGIVRDNLRGEAVKAAIMRKSEHLFKDENARETAFREIDAYELQRNFAAMANVQLPANGDFAYFLDHDGSVETGRNYEEGLLWAVYSDRKDVSSAAVANAAKDARQEILDTRRTQLVLRIWDAKGDERMRLMALAEAAKMTDGNGELKRSDAYLIALAAWAQGLKAKGESGEKSIETYAASVRRRMEIASDPAFAKGLAKELLVLRMVTEGDRKSKAENEAAQKGGHHG